MLDGLLQPVLITDFKLHIVMENQSSVDFFGSELTGQLIFAAIRQPDALQCIARARDQARPADTRVPMSANSIDTEFEINVCPIALFGPEDDTLLIMLKDVTEMSGVEKLRRDFVANVSHELRSPLTALSGFIHTLQNLPPDDDSRRRKFLGIMEGEAARMNRLVNNLLSLSKVESDERVQPQARVDIVEILGAVIQSLKPLADEREANVQLDTRHVGLKMRGDSDQLSQLFFNLLENALKYGCTGNEVRIHCQKLEHSEELAGPTIRITVCDQGDGIDPIHLPRLTERFYRVDEHRSQTVGGTGLGLAIVKHIVQRHRGRLAISSTPGKGSAFSVILPASTVAAGREYTEFS